MDGHEMVADLVARRGKITAGGLPHNFLELHGATMVEVTAYEPDPRTYRGWYYYNAVADRLFRRVVTDRRDDGAVRAQWIPV